MLHIHFGTGRLGLGLVAPFLKTPDSELFLLNRASSGHNVTGSTALDPARRNELLKCSLRHEYLIETPGSMQTSVTEPRERVQYDGFSVYGDGDVAQQVQEILNGSRGKSKGIVVSGSVLTVENYVPVVDALNAICRAKEAGDSEIGDVYLIACENTVSAHEVLKHDDLADQIEEFTRKHVHCVHALVDRVCVEIEECTFEGEPEVMVRAEEYGSLKLELCPNTEGLPKLLQGSKAEFSRYLDIEKEIKLWLLNGSHWLIALTAFRESDGNVDLKLDDFINATKDHRTYAAEVVNEMRDGIEALLRSNPQYAPFVKDVDVSAYLDGAAASILERFKANDDTITRILARFRAPTPEETTTVQSFVDRFLHKIEQPLVAYQAAKGIPPKAATQGIFNLFRLQASGTYVDTAHHQEDQAA
ncbi:MAG: hypothetical protein ACRYFU_01375 [Janthinobacterium lividum]